MRAPIPVQSDFGDGLLILMPPPFGAKVCGVVYALLAALPVYLGVSLAYAQHLATVV
jgi:hypothetical protein